MDTPVPDTSRPDASPTSAATAISDPATKPGVKWQLFRMRRNVQVWQASLLMLGLHPTGKEYDQLSGAQLVAFKTWRNTLLSAMVERNDYGAVDPPPWRLYTCRPAVAFGFKYIDAEDQFLDLFEVSAFAHHFNLNVPEELLAFSADTTESSSHQSQDFQMKSEPVESADDGDLSDNAIKAGDAQGLGKSLATTQAIIACLLPLAFRDVETPAQLPSVSQTLEELMQIKDSRKLSVRKEPAIHKQIKSAIQKYPELVTNGFVKRKLKTFGGTDDLPRVVISDPS